MIKNVLILVLGILGFLSAIWPAQSQRAGRSLVMEAATPHRRALVIGNANYTGAAPLLNTINDAKAMATTLGDVGFEVQHGENLHRITLERAINTFVEGINSRDVALFYYAGHGMELSNENYLIPVDFSLSSDEAEAKHEAYSANVLLEKLEARRPALIIIILDACRNNPFRSIRGGGGLAAMQAGTGVFVAFATSPGRTASDNREGKNGLFTGRLIEALAKPGLTLHEVFDEAGTNVITDSGGAQVPWSNNTPIGRFVFRDIAEQLKKTQAERIRIEADIARAQEEVDRLKKIDQQSKVARDRDAVLQAEARLRSLHLEEDRKRADIKRWEALESERREIDEANQEQDAIETRRRDGEVRQLADLRERAAALRSSNTNPGQPATAGAALAEWRSINAQIQEIEAEFRQTSQKAIADAESSYNELVSKIAGSRAVRDPFETSQDFQNRLTKFEEQLKQIETRRQSEVAGIRNNYETEMGKASKSYKERQALIERGYYPMKDSSAWAWKSYEPDQSALWMALGDTLLLCRVPTADARLANSSRDLLKIEAHFQFSASVAKLDGYSVGHPAFAERRTCEKIAADRFVTELNALLERNDFEAFRKQADFALHVGANNLLRIKLLHHHSTGFHEALLGVGRAGLYVDPLTEQCSFTAGVIASDRILEVTIVHQGSSGVMLHIVVRAGKNFDKSAPLNFSVLGSTISPEAETKSSKFGTMTTTNDRVQSPPGAEKKLSAIAWLIDRSSPKNAPAQQ